MGSGFRAPRQQDARHWLELEVLSAFDITYQPGGCDVLGKRPFELGDVEESLLARGRSRVAVKRLRRMAGSRA